MQNTRSALRSARVAKGVTQGVMADAVNISKSYLRHIEAGRHVPRTAVMVRVAKYLGRQPSELFEELNVES